MTPEIRKLIRKRKRLQSRAKKRNSEDMWSKFRKLRNEIVMKITSKTKYLGEVPVTVSTYVKNVSCHLVDLKKIQCVSIQ